MPSRTSSRSVPAYVGALGSDKAVLLAAMKLGTERAAERGIRHLTVAIARLGNLQGAIDCAFGERFTRVISREYHVDVAGYRIHLATQRRPLSLTGPVVALFTPPKQTRELLADPRTTELVFVPWSDHDVEQFEKIAPHAARF